jgi:hypothetical protein
MAQFWASTSSTSFSYTQGQTLTLKVRATNAIGAGPQSALATGPVVSTVPDNPISAPVRDEVGTSTTQITLNMPEITSGSTAAGSVAISSYNLQWN